MKIANFSIGIIFLFFTVFNVSAQYNSDNYWNSILENNNKEAYNTFTKSEKEYEKSKDILIGYN